MFESLLSVLKTYDDTFPPGPAAIIAGDSYLGFSGEFKLGLPGPDALANLVGVTEGSPFVGDHAWLKFVENGKLIYISKLPMRYGIRWQQLDEKELIFGKIIQIGRHKFRIRVMTGLTNNASGGEWNKWMYPICINRPAGTTVLAAYTSAQLGSGNFAGAASWVQEEATPGVSTYHCGRGHAIITALNREVKESTLNNYGWRPILEWIDPNAPADPTGPGGQVLLNGTTDAGYYGRVDTSLIGSNSEVSLACGMESTGVLIADTPNWLKFVYRNRVMYIPQKPLRHTMRWLDLKNAGVTDEGKEVILNGYRYRVRLMLVATKDSANQNGNQTGREWRDLLYNTMTASTAKWDTFTNADFMVGTQSTGSYTWGQETGTSTGGAGRVGAGYQDMTQIHVNTETNAAAAHMAWRPVLDLIGKA